MPTKSSTGLSPSPLSAVAPSGLGSAALLVGAVACAYLNAFWGAFQFDDYNVIVLNPAVHSVRAWWDSMPGIRPLLKLSYALSWSTGLGPAGFHAVSLLCHAGSGLIVFALVRRWGDVLGIARERVGGVALCAALLFAVHPAQTEAVTYISGRSVSLMAVWYLAALLTHRDGVSGWRAWVSPLLFAAALLTKETAWTLPFALLLVGAADGRGSWRDRLWGLRLHWGVLVLAAAAMLALPGYRRLLAVSLAARDAGSNLLTQIGGQVYLLTQPLLLLRMNIDPDLPVSTAATPGLLLEGAALILLAVAGAVQLWRRPWLGAGILWFFLHLLPTNSVLPRLDVANDRQLYLAIIGPAIVLATVVWSRLPGRLAMLAVLALTLGLGAATVERNWDYRTEVSLWQATAHDSPGKARVWNNLGYAYQISGEVEAARQAYRRALELNPSHVKARANLDALPHE
jgi:hypothetical protein